MSFESNQSQMNAEKRWQRIRGSFTGWGVRLEAGMRLKDLPQDMRIAATPNEGALHPFTFKDGKFVYLNWRQTSPSYWPEATEVVLEPGDYLVETRDGGIGYLRGQP